MRTRLFGSALAACALAGVVVAAQAPAPQTSAPIFRSGVETVEVDAIVTDKDGKFVRNLTLDDFEVLQDGKKQPLALLTLVEHPIPNPAEPLPAVPAEPDVATNAGANEGRIYILVLDGLHIAPANLQRTVTIARQFVERYLGEADMMAVLHIGGTASYSQELTRNRTRLLASIDRFRGGNDLMSESQSVAQTSTATQVPQEDGSTASLLVADLFETERALQTTRSLDALKQIATRLGSVRGRRKSLIFVSEGFSTPGALDNPADPSLTEINNARRRQLADDLEVALQDATRQATLNDVTIYTMDPRGLRPNGGVADGVIDTSDAYIAQAIEDAKQIQSMRDVAALTGGSAIVNTNNLTGGLQRLVVENSAYYVLAFTPTPLVRDGKFHKLEVRVKTKGLSVKSRRGYLAASNTAPTPPSAKSGMSVEAFEAMKRPVPTTGLAISLFAAAFRKDAKTASVLIGTELQGRELRLSGAPLEVEYAMIDATGRVRASRSLNINANLREETQTRANEHGLRVLQRLEVPPGRYQIRVAVNQPGSATGSVVHDLDVPDFNATIAISSVLLTSHAAGDAATVVSDQELRTALPNAPGALRKFTTDDEVTVLTEAYDNRQTPGDLIVTVTVTKPNGDVVKKVPAILQSGGDKPRYTATLPLEGYAPGQYILIVDARAQANAQAILAPPVPFSVTK